MLSYSKKKDWAGLISLEYNNFFKRGFNLHFEAYEYAIKIFIYFPKSIAEIVPSKLKLKEENLRFSRNNELEYNVYGNFVKYYFETINKRIIDDWNEDILKQFLGDLGILIDTVFSKIN